MEWIHKTVVVRYMLPKQFTIRPVPIVVQGCPPTLPPPAPGVPSICDGITVWLLRWRVSACYPAGTVRTSTPPHSVVYPLALLFFVAGFTFSTACTHVRKSSGVHRITCCGYFSVSLDGKVLLLCWLLLAQAKAPRCSSRPRI